MCDTASVVGFLKKTPKGKLNYDEKLDLRSLLIREESPPISLHLSPGYEKDAAKTMSRSKNLQKSSVSVDKYKDYLQMSQTSGDASKSDYDLIFKHLPKTPEPLQSPQYVSKAREVQKQLIQCEQEYSAMLQQLKEKRLERMNTAMQKLEEEHTDTVTYLCNSASKRVVDEEEKLVQLETDLQCKAMSELEDHQKKQIHRCQIADETSRKLEAKRKEIEAERIKLEQQEKIRIKKTKTLQDLGTTITGIINKIINLIRWCQNKKEVPPERYSSISQTSAANSQKGIAIVNAGVNTGKDLDAKISEVSNIIKFLEQSLVTCQQLVDEITKKEEEEKKKKEEVEAKKAAVAAAATAQPSSSSVASSVEAATVTPSVTSTPVAVTPSVSVAVPSPATVPAASSGVKNINLYTTPACLDEYSRLLGVIEDNNKKHENLTTSADKGIKSFKFELHKAVNTTINAISDESPKHLLDKVFRLNNILSDKPVEVGLKKIDTNGSAMARAMVRDLIARKIVMQGVQQVSSSYKAAFPIAAVAVCIGALHADVNELLIAYFYKKCPYLVPYYLPKKEGQSTEDYCRDLGYEVKGSDVESEDKYLKKLSGIVRLYAACIQTEIPSHLPNKVHPHGLDHGWCWFSRILNLEPRPNVTATVLFDFLEVAGNALLNRYGTQFQKLLILLCQETIPKIESITPSESQSSVVRLKLLLEDVIKNGELNPPEGQLTVQWWSTGKY